MESNTKEFTTAYRLCQGSRHAAWGLRALAIWLAAIHAWALYWLSHDDMSRLPFLMQLSVAATILAVPGLLVKATYLLGEVREAEKAILTGLPPQPLKDPN